MNTSLKSIQENIHTLNSRDVLDRQRAREDLIKAGPPALDALLQALHNSDDQVRWEAARILREIKDPSIVPELIQSLRDDNFVVRWMASEALIELGRSCLIPLLRALVAYPEPGWLQVGAHQIETDPLAGPQCDERGRMRASSANRCDDRHPKIGGSRPNA